jgi:hypothetical protein
MVIPFHFKRLFDDDQRAPYLNGSGELLYIHISCNENVFNVQDELEHHCI